MLFAVVDLLGSPVGSAEDHALPAGVRLGLDPEMVATIDSGRVRLERTPAGIRAEGEVQARVSVPCARCLETAEVRLTGRFSEDFAPVIDPLSGEGSGSPHDDLIFALSPAQVLDLREALRQNLLGMMPIQPLCRPDCAGLCPTCGTDRNANRCDCGSDGGQASPFVALAGLVTTAP